MEIRRSRVPLEPDLTSPHEYISVRHINLGTKSRLFSSSSLFSVVYDWIGSLSNSPEFFQIKDHKGITVQPDSIIISGTYNMVRTETAPLLISDGEISFQGFGNYEEEDPNLHYTKLINLVSEEKKKLVRHQTFTVNRDNIYESMISLYKKRNVRNTNINLRFEGEDAVGDGVTRDAFSEFHQGVYDRFEGEFQKIPSNFNDIDELKIVGEIITHGFILSGIFPLQICKATLKHYLFGSCKEEELFHSFLRFVPEKERTFIEHWDGKSNPQRIIDLLTEYGVFAVPTLDNLQSLIIKAATIAIIRQPCFPMQTIIESMGNFWKHVSIECVDALYKSCEVDPEKFIAVLDIEEKCSSDQKITTWFHRYIRNLRKSQLSLLLRFITGSECLSPSVIIKLIYANGQKYPTVKTCFKIITLPRQYNSYFELRDNLNKVIERPENWSVHDEETE